MSRSKRIAFVVCLTLIASAILFLFRSPEPSYAGRSVEEWFQFYGDGSGNKSPLGRLSAAEWTNVQAAFRAMGTNAVPFLAERITQSQDYSRFTLWRLRNRQRIPVFFEELLPPVRSKVADGQDAAELLAVCVKPPGEMLVPVLEPVLRGTNQAQRTTAVLALRGISSGYDLARPHLARGLQDPDSQLQKCSAMAVRWHGINGRWAISNLLEAARSANSETLDGALQALNELGTNSVPILPELREMWIQETNKERRAIIANAINYISGSVPPSSNNR